MKITTLILILALLIPRPAKAQTNNQTAIACTGLVVGGVAFWMLYRFCDHYLPPPTNAPPPPPAVPPPNWGFTNVPKYPDRARTNNFPAYKIQAFQMGDAAIEQDISALGYPDTNGSVPSVYQATFALALESSSNFASWNRYCVITGYVSSVGAFLSFYTNGVLALNAYSSGLDTTNWVQTEMLGIPTARSKFFRAVRP